MNSRVNMQLSQILVLELHVSVIYNWHNRFMNTVTISIKIIWLQKDLILPKNARPRVKVANKLLSLIRAVVIVPTGIFTKPRYNFKGVCTLPIIDLFGASHQIKRYELTLKRL